MTIEGAPRDYGVVITGDPDEYPEEVAVDAAATAQLRDARR